MGKKRWKVKQHNQGKGGFLKKWSTTAVILFILLCAASSGFYLGIFEEHRPAFQKLIDAGVPFGWQGALAVTLLLATGAQGALLGLFAAAGTQELLSRE